MSPPALRLQGIGKGFGGRPVLRGLDLEVAPDETVAVLGANGSGKSTLLRIAATLSRPDEGTVTVAGRDAAKDALAARRRLGALTQEAPLYGHLTPHEHVAWWARMQGVDVDADGNEALVADAGLAPVAHRPCATLSRGQRQRLAFALALLPPRELVVLDEPFAALDDAGRAWATRRLAARHGATLVALHDATEAARIADRVVHLAGGRLS